MPPHGHAATPRSDFLWKAAFGVIGVLLTVSGYLASSAFSDVKTALLRIDDKWAEQLRETQKSFWSAQGIMAKNQADYSVKLGVLGEKVDQQGKRIDQLEVSQFKNAFPNHN